MPEDGRGARVFRLDFSPFSQFLNSRIGMKAAVSIREL
jgi:hypothetical protein